MTLGRAAGAVRGVAAIAMLLASSSVAGAAQEAWAFRVPGSPQRAAALERALGDGGLDARVEVTDSLNLGEVPATDTTVWLGYPTWVLVEWAERVRLRPLVGSSVQIAWETWAPVRRAGGPQLETWAQVRTLADLGRVWVRRPQTHLPEAAMFGQLGERADGWVFAGPGAPELWSPRSTVEDLLRALPSDALAIAPVGTAARLAVESEVEGWEPLLFEDGWVGIPVGGAVTSSLDLDRHRRLEAWIVSPAGRAALQAFGLEPLAPSPHDDPWCRLAAQRRVPLSSEVGEADRRAVQEAWSKGPASHDTFEQWSERFDVAVLAIVFVAILVVAKPWRRFVRASKSPRRESSA